VYPHPALRATFSRRREKGFSPSLQDVLGAPLSRLLAGEGWGEGEPLHLLPTAPADDELSFRLEKWQERRPRPVDRGRSFACERGGEPQALAQSSDLAMLQAVTPEERPAPWLRREIVATFSLSWPLIVANLASSLMTTTDIMMLGWLSPEALAAGALGYNLYFPLLLFGIGLVSAASPIVARMIGADPDDLSGPRRAAQQSFLSAAALALPIWAVLWSARRAAQACRASRDLFAWARMGARAESAVLRAAVGLRRP
jgi:hypothetical protein